MNIESGLEVAFVRMHRVPGLGESQISLYNQHPPAPHINHVKYEWLTLTMND